MGGVSPSQRARYLAKSTGVSVVGPGRWRSSVIFDARELLGLLVVRDRHAQLAHVLGLGLEHLRVAVRVPARIWPRQHRWSSSSTSKGARGCRACPPCAAAAFSRRRSSSSSPSSRSSSMAARRAPARSRNGSPGPRGSARGPGPRAAVGHAAVLVRPVLHLLPLERGLVGARVDGLAPLVLALDLEHRVDARLLAQPVVAHHRLHALLHGVAPGSMRKLARWAAILCFSLALSTLPCMLG